MDTGSMILEITVITAAILLPILVVALMIWSRQLEKSGRKQNALTKIGMVALEVLVGILIFLAKLLSFLLVGEWSYAKAILTEEEEK